RSNPTKRSHINYENWATNRLSKKMRDIIAGVHYTAMMVIWYLSNVRRGKEKGQEEEKNEILMLVIGC
ncbi:24108_t:CDS:1, partial [Dentiscutata erythropus]